MSAPYFADGAVTIWNADALALPIPDESVDLIVTSPPYFGLRSYTDGGEHYEGQIGSEASPREFVDALVSATAEMVRVLKSSGSIFVNLGDKYARPGGGVDRAERSLDGAGAGATARRSTPTASCAGIPEKSLMGLPWRYAIRCVDELGLILRAELIWSKPNGLPESVTDRVRRSHEQWFHFTREPRYFSAVDEIREAHKPGQSASALSFNREGRETAPGQSCTPHRLGREDQGLNPLGKLPGSVWEVPTQPLKVPAHLGIDHFAAFPMEWPRRIIRGWSPRGICVECGEGRRPIVDRERTQSRGGVDCIRGANDGSIIAMSGGSGFGQRAETTATITGYACACPEPTAPTRPAIVLDPFGGTGTTALVAKALGRTGWHVDLSADYCRLAQWRVTDPGELARAMQVEKPPAAPEGMDSLLDILGEAS